MFTEGTPVDESGSTASKAAPQQNGIEDLWIPIENRDTAFTGVTTGFAGADFGGILVELPPPEADSV